MKKLLYIKMGTHNLNMSISLNKIFESYEIDWISYKENWFRLNSDIRRWFDIRKPDVVLLHIQQGDVIHPELLIYMSQRSIVVNWTGDVRYPIPQHYIDVGKLITLTLFTNYNDVLTARQRGIKSDFLQVGYDDNSFVASENNIYDRDAVFIGSNYDNVFPLSNERYQMGLSVKNWLGDRFEIFGSGWRDLSSGYVNNYAKECEIYQKSKIGINLSHFDYSRYSSDRMFRLMGSGTFCLTHNYKDIEKDFVIGKDLVVWNDLSDLKDKLDYYLNNDHERIIIANSGHDKVKNNFTWLHFAENLLNLTNNI